MKRTLTLLLLLIATCSEAAAPIPSHTQRKITCSDTIFYKNGATAVITFKRQNGHKVFYKACDSDFTLTRSISAENVDKVVLSSGEVLLPGKKHQKEKSVAAKILIVFGVALGAIALGFGFILLLYAVLQPW